MPDEMLDNRRPVAARNAVAPNPAFFQMGCINSKDVAFPLTGGESLRRVQRIIRRVRPTIHPDRTLRAPGKMVRVNGNELLRILIAFLPNPHACEARNIVGRMYPALILG